MARPHLWICVSYYDNAQALICITRNMALGW